MPMLTPFTITIEAKRQAKRRFLSLIDLAIEEDAYEIIKKHGSLTDAPGSLVRELNAMVEQRNILARSYHSRERERLSYETIAKEKHKEALVS
jgi:uncharacterized protein YutE (UPF0331/DUF86 family)